MTTDESEAFKWYQEKIHAAELGLAISFSDRADQLMPEERVVYKGILSKLAERYVSETVRRP